MRVSADPRSPDHPSCLLIAPRRLSVLLDGVPQERVKVADEERGYVIVYLNDGAGKPLRTASEYVTQLRFGRVQILVAAERLQ